MSTVLRTNTVCLDETDDWIGGIGDGNGRVKNWILCQGVGLVRSLMINSLVFFA